MSPITHLISFIPLLFVGIAALAGLRAFVYDFPRPLKILAVLWLVLLATEVAGYVMRERSIENQWLYNLLDFFFCMVLARVYELRLNDEWAKVAVNIFYVVFAALWLGNNFFYQGIFTFQTLSIVVGGSFLIFLSGVYFREMLFSEDNEKLTRDPFFWISSGLIVYFAGTVPFLGMLNYLMSHFRDFAEFYFYYFYAAFHIFLNLLVMVGFLCRKKYPKSSLSW